VWLWSESRTHYATLEPDYPHLDERGKIEGMSVPSKTDRIPNATVACAVFFAAFVVMIAVCCKRTPVEQKEDDIRISRAVQDAIFRDHSIRTKDITISCNKGVVTLSGSLTGDDERLAAQKDAAQVPGVTSVINAFEMPSTLKTVDDQMTGRNKKPSQPLEDLASGVLARIPVNPRLAFQDDLDEIARRNSYTRKDDDDIRALVLKAAAEEGVSVTEKQITVSRRYGELDIVVRFHEKDGSETTVRAPIETTVPAPKTKVRPATRVTN
jgi:BON domain-containing protein